VFLSGRPSLLIDGANLFEADFSVLPRFDEEDILETVNRLRLEDQVRPMPAFGLTIRRQLRLLLDHAIQYADLTDKAEFWDLLDLVMGLGVKARELAKEIELQPEMISRYRKRSTAPAKVRERREILRAALELAPERGGGAEGITADTAEAAD
jgi:hypothetical protein